MIGCPHQILGTDLYEEGQFSADENLMEGARLVAQMRQTTLNAAFREWLAEYARHTGGTAAIESLMRRATQARASRAYMRGDELNEP